MCSTIRSFCDWVHTSKIPVPGLDNAAHVKPNKLLHWHQEQLVDLLGHLVLGHRHEKQLVEESKDSQATEEPDCQAGVGHGCLHAVEVVGDDEGPEIKVEQMTMPWLQVLKLKLSAGTTHVRQE